MNINEKAQSETLTGINVFENEESIFQEIGFEELFDEKLGMTGVQLFEDESILNKEIRESCQ